MKVLLPLIASVYASALLACQNEALVIAKVAKFEVVNGDCMVTIQSASTWNENFMCPLFYEEAYQSPIVVKNSLCKELPESIDGIIFRAEDGTLQLE